MKRETWLLSLVLILAATIALGALACGDDDDDDSGDDDDTDDDDDDDSTGSGECVELVYNLHDADAGQVFVYLATMTTTDEAVTDYDYVTAAQMPEPPLFLLGLDVAAADGGSDDAFDAFDEAPADGYVADGDDPAIGTDWQVGGNGQDGYEMAGTVYALKLADGTYAKISVTSAQVGEIHVDAYHQPDGSRNLACSWPE